MQNVIQILRFEIVKYIKWELSSDCCIISLKLRMDYLSQANTSYRIYIVDDG
jgi:hypothetical protein